MRDHLIDMRLESASAGSIQAREVSEQHREALTAALGEDFARRCADSMNTTQIDCVLAAEDNDAVAACSVKEGAR